MGKAAKLRAEKARVKAKEQRQTEAQKVAANAERLKGLTAGFARTDRTREIVQAHNASKFPQYVKQHEVGHRDLTDRFTMGPQKRLPTPISDEEMARRELAAKEHYERAMKPRIGAPYNKAGDQYLSESELTAQMKGELRRRS